MEVPVLIEKILNLDDKKVEVEKLDEMGINDLRRIRDEIQLISNETALFKITQTSSKKMKLGDEITGLDALWAHVNIALASKESSA